MDKNDIHYNVLRLCGCGSPEEAHNLAVKLLSLADRRAHRNGEGEWVNLEEEQAALIAQDTQMAAHLFNHLLTNLGLMEHGGSVGGSWLTDTGEMVVDAGEVTEDDLH